MNGVKESARLFQKMHLDTILYEAKAIIRLFISLPTSRVDYVGCSILENNDWLYFINLEAEFHEVKNIVLSIP